MLVPWEGGEGRVTKGKSLVPWDRTQSSMISSTPQQDHYNRPTPLMERRSTGSSEGFTFPLPRLGGDVIYRSSTSRVYSLHGNCAEERRAQQDSRSNTEELSVTRVLNNRSATYTQHRDMCSGTVEMRRSAVNVPEEEHRQFDKEWMRVASTYLPPYNNNNIAFDSDRQLPLASHHHHRRAQEIESSSAQRHGRPLPRGSLFLQ